MTKAVTAIRKGFLYISALVLVTGYPTAAMATTQEPVTDSAPAVTETSAPEEQPITYTFDPVTKKWNSEEWQWNVESQSYERPPEPIIIEPQAPAPVSAESDGPTDTSSASEASSEKTVDTNVDINNKITSDAQSGDSLISENTEAGSAITGDAAAVATIVNSVNSSVGAAENQKIATFTKDIIGDVKGDIVLYPLLLKAMLEAEAQEKATTINNTSDLNVHNDITLNAQSGNATVDSNTRAGDATTGNATAMANVVNILNSLIATQDSFIGTINIYGSLEGDILIAPDFIPQMIANNGGDSGSSTQLSKSDTTTIVNNISAVAESGAADVFNNTNAGSATTGDAESKVVIFNVTGHDIVAENSMLVFVNVLGTWVGMIVDAPAGATAAMIGTGVTNNEKYAPDLVVESESNHGITNTIAVNAASGDATVSNNTHGGNATSGNAHAFANVANVSNSSLSLTGWFGLLFINITGNWFGSFQVDTPYGNSPAPVATPKPVTGPVQFIPAEERPVQTAQPVTYRTIIDSRFLDNSTTVAAAIDAQTSVEVEGETAEQQLADTEVKGDSTTEANNVEESGINRTLLFAAGSVILAGAAVAGARRYL